MATQVFDAALRSSRIDQQRATRFLSIVSWIIVGVLGAMAASMWIVPMARAAGNLPLARVLGLGFALEFFALIALVVILRKRLATQIARVATHYDVTVAQNARLTEQNLELEQQTESLQEQAIQLEERAAELEDANRALRAAERQQHELADASDLLARRLSEAQNVAQLGYWEIDRSSGDVFWSDEMYRLIGVEPGVQPPPTDQFLSALHPEDAPRMRDVAARALADLSEFTEQYRLIGTDGAPRTIQARGRVVTSARGDRKLVGTIQDITERTQLETQLRQSQKMDAIGKLAGGVAHDFNNILTVIEGYTALLLAELPAEATNRSDVEQIRDAARRAATLTRQLLAFSRQQHLQPRVLNVNDAIGGIEKMLQRLIGEDVELQWQLHPEIQPVKADPGQLEQVLMNLVVNARDAMPDGGKLTIETANVSLDTHYAQRFPVKHPGPHVMLAVTDTGCGIPAHDFHRIFEPFFTTKENGKGTGLGLSTVHGIVEQSGGHVWVYSEVGHGTTFKVYLPACELEADDVDVFVAAPRSGGETILLVEDDPTLRTMASTILSRAGYQVIETKNGVEALHICRDQTRHIDLVVSDMVMPAMGGRDLVNNLKAVRTIPTLLMSGYTRDSIARNGDLHGASFIEKPFTPEALIRRVRELLDGGRGGLLP
jgi:signal transduction histidine kinase